jgi:hypothetical protein
MYPLAKMITAFYPLSLARKVLILLIVAMTPAALSAAPGPVDGRWLLRIDGRDQLEFGLENLAGGIRVQWRSELEFTVESGQFLRGSGRAELLPDIEAVSRPAGFFDCAPSEGVFANRSGQSFDMPHLRYRSFPMRGELRRQNEAWRVILRPDLKYPGNYIAVMYRCSTGDEQGALWLEASPRVARELGKRQNAEREQGIGRFGVSVKEVKTLPPGPLLELPLQDGLEFTLESEYGMRRVVYRLQRLD